MDTGAASSGIKWQGFEADHSPPFTAEVKNSGAKLYFPLRVHGMMFD
jgi:hypothetical protein